MTGKPGSGKSSLAYSVAHEVNMGPVLRWAINSRSTLAEGLYNYDAIARLREANLARRRPPHELFPWEYAMKRKPPPDPRHRSWMPEKLFPQRCA